MSSQIETAPWQIRKYLIPLILALFLVANVVIAVVLVMAWRQIVVEQKIVVARTAVLKLHQACLQYSKDHDGYPPKNLDELTRKDARGFGPYVNAADLIDPWGKEFLYD